MNIAVPAKHQVKVKVRAKLEKYLDLTRFNETTKYCGAGTGQLHTSTLACFEQWQKFSKEIGRTGNLGKNWNLPDYNITEKAEKKVWMLK